MRSFLSKVFMVIVSLLLVSCSICFYEAPGYQKLSFISILQGISHFKKEHQFKEYDKMEHQVFVNMEVRSDTTFILQDTAAYFFKTKSNLDKKSIENGVTEKLKELDVIVDNNQKHDYKVFVHTIYVHERITKLQQDCTPIEINNDDCDYVDNRIYEVDDISQMDFVIIAEVIDTSNSNVKRIKFESRWFSPERPKIVDGVFQKNMISHFALTVKNEINKLSKRRKL